MFSIILDITVLFQSVPVCYQRLKDCFYKLVLADFVLLTYFLNKVSTDQSLSYIHCQMVQILLWTFRVEIV